MRWGLQEMIEDICWLSRKIKLDHEDDGIEKRQEQRKKILSCSIYLNFFITYLPFFIVQHCALLTHNF